ncbi:hypothetical protein RM780_07275 [Streptomyces sp. DSM 44917]|uniref:Sulfotransferase n=1 Tax=Streptomyces boetiae TaxID=3075541 RepID=A0ABU2L617_9ACTN|nr:hypothetical protein [Streptomyces sp. DSM 44917]MDT0306763.1 hypothetical protein [Streptomyces sp. DSM 44917]
MDRVRVLYIGGLGRSGSTVLSRALGGLPGFFHVGELVFLWTRGAGLDELCGCGSTFRSCPFWTEVGERAYGGWDAVDCARVAGLKHRVDRTRYLPQLLGPRPPAAFRRRLDELAGLLSPLYAAIRDVGGCRVVVDSSKHVSYAAVLRRLPGVDLRLLHVTRDSRGVAHSWAKSVRRPEGSGSDAYMARVPVPKLAARWTAFNGLLDVLRMVHEDAAVLRYERFVAEPDAVLREIAALAGAELAPADLDFLTPSAGPGRPPELKLAAEHSVSGNPMRFDSGTVPLRLDDAWRGALPPRDRALVTALTAPGMLRYGYRLRKAPAHPVGHQT